MLYEKVETAVLPVYKVPASKEGDFYYITVFPTKMENGEQIITCSCPDFQLGRPKRGIDPHVDPCKHVVAFKANRM